MWLRRRSFTASPRSQRAQNTGVSSELTPTFARAGPPPAWHLAAKRLLFIIASRASAILASGPSAQTLGTQVHGVSNCCQRRQSPPNAECPSSSAPWWFSSPTALVHVQSGRRAFCGLCSALQGTHGLVFHSLAARSSVGASGPCLQLALGGVPCTASSRWAALLRRALAVSSASPMQVRRLLAAVRGVGARQPERTSRAFIVCPAAAAPLHRGCLALL